MLGGGRVISRKKVFNAGDKLYLDALSALSAKDLKQAASRQMTSRRVQRVENESV